MPDIDALLDQNRAFAESGAWRNTPRLPFLPFQKPYVITCIDPTFMSLAAATIGASWTCRESAFGLRSGEMSRRSP